MVKSALSSLIRVLLDAPRRVHKRSDLIFPLPRSARRNNVDSVTIPSGVCAVEENRLKGNRRFAKMNRVMMRTRQIRIPKTRRDSDTSAVESSMRSLPRTARSPSRIPATHWATRRRKPEILSGRKTVSPLSKPINQGILRRCIRKMATTDGVR